MGFFELALASLAVLLVTTVANADDIFLAHQPGLLSAEHEQFMDRVTQSFKKSLPGVFDEFTPGDFLTATLDLNSDGVEEMIVQPMTTIFCGNNNRCPAFVYLKAEAGWAYAG